VQFWSEQRISKDKVATEPPPILQKHKITAGISGKSLSIYHLLNMVRLEPNHPDPWRDIAMAAQSNEACSAGSGSVSTSILWVGALLNE
jgi:hypothetical protein